VRPLHGWTGRLTSILSVGLTLYALYWAVGIIQPQIYRITFLLIVLTLCFLVYPATLRKRAGVAWLDWLFVLLSCGSLVWPLADFQDFIYRAASPTGTDVVLGVLTIFVVLEATRRSAGLILPATALLFVAYAYAGPLLDRVGLGAVAHRGYDLSRLAGSLYMTLEGIFGVPLEVAATYIVLFSIYGAVLQASGAGRFFLTWSLSAVGRSGGAAGPGRAVTVAGLLLGAMSGSGVANTVTLGSVAWPLLKRVGYAPETAGAMLSAAGIGAIICPPALGAAAFVIAEFLHISYLQVMKMAALPALLYFLSILLMIEVEARRTRSSVADLVVPPVGLLTRRYGYHFLALAGIPALLLAGATAFRAVFIATLIAIALSFFDREHALWPRRLFSALDKAGRSVISIAATTAAAGIVVGVVTLTGLGLKTAGLIVSLAGGSLLLTIVYSALAVWMLGLAVPVTASYIIAAVMVAPAMVQVGVPDTAAHMFIFYYAVLSEVSPPTALSPFAAAALTGGKPMPTMMRTWKYTLPAFIFPFGFTLSKQGSGILLQGSPGQIVIASLMSTLGVLALAFGLGGWLEREASRIERVLATFAGLLFFYPGVASRVLAMLLLASAVALHLRAKR
jgi:TRAP transporter 4TM/12TM fusion protein